MKSIYGIDDGYLALKKKARKQIRSIEKNKNIAIVCFIATVVGALASGIIWAVEPSQSIGIINHLLTNDQGLVTHTSKGIGSKIYNFINGDFGKAIGALILLNGVLFGMMDNKITSFIISVGLSGAIILGIWFGPGIINGMELKNHGFVEKNIIYKKQLVSANNIAVNDYIERDKKPMKGRVIKSEETNKKLEDNIKWLENHNEKDWYKSNINYKFNGKARYIAMVEHTANIPYTGAAKKYMDKRVNKIKRMEKAKWYCFDISSIFALIGFIFGGLSYYEYSSLYKLYEKVGKKWFNEVLGIGVEGDGDKIKFKEETTGKLNEIVMARSAPVIEEEPKW